LAIFERSRKKNFKVSLNIQYSADKEHKLTKVINAKLLALSISGYSTGEVLVENCKIDSWYIRNFSAQLGSNFYDIKPFRKETEETKLEIHKSNLDKFGLTMYHLMNIQLYLFTEINLDKLH
jgi:hypothetical protein